MHDVPAERGRTFYTYVHLRADDGRVFYVGKGKGERATATDGRNPHWQRTAAKHGWRSEIAARWQSEAEAFEHERFLIACFRDMGHPLTNKTDGGEGRTGYRLSEESKRLIGDKNRGRVHSEETRRKNSEARKGKPLPREVVEKVAAALRGHAVSEETRQKISERRKGQRHPQEVIERIKSKTKGRQRSDEFKAKVSAGLKGRVVSAETRAKLSAAHKGRVITEEQRQKIAASLRGRKLSEEHRAKSAAHLRSPELREAQSRALKGKPWPEARRSAALKKVV